MNISSEITKMIYYKMIRGEEEIYTYLYLFILIYTYLYLFILIYTYLYLFILQKFIPGTRRSL